MFSGHPLTRKSTFAESEELTILEQQAVPSLYLDITKCIKHGLNQLSENSSCTHYTEYVYAVYAYVLIPIVIVRNSADDSERYLKPSTSSHHCKTGASLPDCCLRRPRRHHDGKKEQTYTFRKHLAWVTLVRWR